MLAPSVCDAIFWTTAFLSYCSLSDSQTLPAFCYCHIPIYSFSAPFLAVILTTPSILSFSFLSLGHWYADCRTLTSSTQTASLRRPLLYHLLISVLPGATPRAWIHLHHNAQVCRRRYRGAGRHRRRLLAYGVSGTCRPGTNGPDCLPRIGFASHARHSRIIG